MAGTANEVATLKAAMVRTLVTQFFMMITPCFFCDGTAAGWRPGYWFQRLALQYKLGVKSRG
jgi:hypothetical protein